MTATKITTCNMPKLELYLRKTSLTGHNLQEKAMQVWQLQEAKAKFSDLVKAAQNQGPQEVTLHGKPAVIVLSVEDFESLNQPKSNLVDFLKKSPLYGLDLNLERDKSLTRDINL